MIRDAETSSVGIGSEMDGTKGITYTDWKQQFGETIPQLTVMDAVIGAAMANAVTSASIPEPAASSMAIIACLLLHARTRDRNRQRYRRS